MFSPARAQGGSRSRSPRALAGQVAVRGALAQATRQDLVTEPSVAELSATEHSATEHSATEHSATEHRARPSHHHGCGRRSRRRPAAAGAHPRGARADPSGAAGGRGGHRQPGPERGDADRAARPGRGLRHGSRDRVRHRHRQCAGVPSGPRGGGSGRPSRRHRVDLAAARRLRARPRRPRAAARRGRPQPARGRHGPEAEGPVRPARGTRGGHHHGPGRPAAHRGRAGRDRPGAARRQPGRARGQLGRHASPPRRLEPARRLRSQPAPVPRRHRLLLAGARGRL